MANRRQFIQSGITLSATAGLAPLSAQAAAPVDIDGFVYDSRFAEARQIAGHAARHGARLWEIAGDLFDLWSDHLDPQWRKAPKAIAGVTTGPDLFVLETMAADRRMAVVYRGEHGPARNGVLSHALTGPSRLFEEAALEANPDLWAPLLGRAMMGLPARPSPAAALALTSPAAARSDRTEPLYSWVIAPARGRRRPDRQTTIRTRGSRAWPYYPRASAPRISDRR